MSDLNLKPLRKVFDATFTPPGSKSLTNRALILGALADGKSTLRNALFSADTTVMMDGLKRLGFPIRRDKRRRAVGIQGRGGGVPAGSASLSCGLSGTTIRFQAALCALGRGTYRLDGEPRLRQRPIGQLVDLLRNLGARIEYLGRKGYPPIEVRADGLAGGIARFPAAQSSQFLSAALQVCPLARRETRIDLDSPQTSWPYVAMTMQLMDRFGVTGELLRDPKTSQPRQIIVPLMPYQPTDYTVEPDASNASYFLAAAAVNEGSRITIRGLGKQSLQGDVGFAGLLRQMGAKVEMSPDSIAVEGTGALEAINANLADMPDMAQTLAVVALFARGSTTLRGLHTLRVKETDRVAALARELRKLGARVKIVRDTMAIAPPKAPRGAAIDTYNDHRMAMSFAVAGTRVRGVTIRDAGCVAKTYPRFFADWAATLGNRA